ncbi:MAG: hypothetical protein FWD34_05845 [Oscillospiraceae bacterium]|nr:hypothetical protein [Oscillospiraceae bacterium]
MINRNDKMRKLHGNSARVNPNNRINPLFENVTINKYETNRYGRLNALFDNDAEQGKQEVDDNEK